MSELRRWPWLPSVIAGGLVLALMLLLYAGKPLRGIVLASAVNMACVAFFLVGGMFFAARVATGRGGAAFVRPLLAALVPFAGCLLVVVVSRRLTLPDEPFAESFLQDGLGRAVVVYLPAAAVGYVAELFRRVRPAGPRRR
ncbi:hypothetical protein ACFYSC_02835 [Streptosporangium sp. NPDC004379]|uniref:hypothetical protein n=1 Tax=Streptosporangium sp. NPDC004379 TaxID=3366189 RepID=UPI0036B749E2